MIFWYFEMDSLLAGLPDDGISRDLGDLPIPLVQRRRSRQEPVRILSERRIRNQ
jgi:hypothetical protein